MFRKSLFLLTITILMAKSVRTEQDLKLIFVQILFRHGDRSPSSIYPTDPNPLSVWPEGLGQLTLLGRRQQYNLGKFFRLFYGDFRTSNPLEVEVTSADHDRCLKSAEANLASFYAPSKNWKFEEGVDWQPISIRYLPQRRDKFLQVQKNNCPRAEAERLRVDNSHECQQYNAKHKEMYDYLTYHSGSPITGWESAAYLQDNIWIEMLYNLSIPKWVEPYWNELSAVRDFAFYWYFNSPLLHRLHSGPLIQEMIKLMEEKIDGKLPNLKFRMYSAHDTNVAVVLLALKLFDMKQPPYCASLIVELYSGLNNSYYVRLLYLNSTDREKINQTPHPLLLDGCTEFCPLNYFVDYTKHLIPDDWEKECELPKIEATNATGQKIRLGMLFLAIVTILVTVGLVVSVWKIYTNRRDRKGFLVSMSSAS